MNTHPGSRSSSAPAGCSNRLYTWSRFHCRRLACSDTDQFPVRGEKEMINDIYRLKVYFRGRSADSFHLCALCDAADSPCNVTLTVCRRQKTHSSFMSSVYCSETSKTCEVCVCVCSVSHWSIHQECQGRGSSTEVYICHRPGPPHGDGTHTGPERKKNKPINL